MKQYPVLSLNLGNGETLSYRQAGQGEKTIVLVHGNMSSSVHWQPVMEKLESDYHILAPDLRGFGDSSYHQRFDSLRELADDLRDFVTQLGLKSFYLVGWSTGGGVALELAADMQGSVKKVILLDSVPPTGYPMFKRDAQGKPDLTQPLTTKEEIAADPVQVAPVLHAYETNNRAMLRAIWDAVIYNMNKPSEEDYELYLDAIFKQRNLVDIDYSLLTFNMTSSPTASAPGSGRLSLIKCPVTILQGDKDLVVPLAWAQAAHQLIPGSKLIRFEQAGHSVITDDLPLFVQTLRKELA